MKPPQRRDPPTRRVDVLALVIGLAATGAGAGALWTALVGSLDWAVIKIAAPLLLVVIGVVGLAVSRPRN